MKLEAVIAAAVVAAAGCVQSTGAWAQQAWRPVKAVELIVPTAPAAYLQQHSADPHYRSPARCRM